MRWVLVIMAVALSIALVVHAQTLIQPLPPGTYAVLMNESLVTPGYIVIISADPHTFNVAVFTQQNFNLWWNQSQAEPAIYHGTIIRGSVLAIPAPAGNYVIAIYPVPGSNYYVEVYVFNDSDLPIGIASFPTSPIVTNELMGYFDIGGIMAYNPSGRSQFGVWNSGASLQLNAVVVVELVNGQYQYYWVQDVVQFVTGSNEFYVVDNVWNYTSPTPTLSNQSIVGNGAVYNSSGGLYYGYATSSSTYSPPLGGYLIMNAYASGGVVHVDFGYVIIRNGGYEWPTVIWFDNVTIMPSTPATNAYFEVGAQLTGGGWPMDAEFVFAGYGNGEWTRFNQLSANLSMLYWNGSGWEVLPTLYDFGFDTEESAVTNINVTVSSNNLVAVTLGTFKPGFIATQLPTPILPMTYVSYTNPVTGYSFSYYVTQPTMINIPSVVYISNNTRYVLEGYYLNSQWVYGTTITITPNKNWFMAYDISPQYQLQYLVSVASPLPVYFNGLKVTNYSTWINASSTVTIIARSQVLNNGTMLTPSITNETVIIDGPTTLTITWTPKYLVSITSTKPVYVDDKLTINYMAWLIPGMTLTIRAPTYNVYGGLVLYQPNITAVTITVNKPISLTITYTPNYTRLYIVTVVVMIIFIITAITLRRKRHK